jgi:signal transduction histidine kinase
MLKLLRRNASMLWIYGSGILIFGVVFKLYNLPLEPILYALFLTVLWITFYGLQQYWRILKRHKLLSALVTKLEAGIDELPEPMDAIEADYQELLRLMDRNQREAISKADRLHMDMTNYYSMWAHQIKTPIAAIRLLLQTEETPLNEELSEQIFKTEQYVEMVLHYLRIEDMSSDLLIKEYQLDDIVRQVIRKCRKMFIRKKINLDYKELNCTVLTDEKWLVFVVEQVISNALKYTKEGSISIYMDEDQEKTLVIEDTGIGIKDEDLPRVFEKGFTGFNGRADKKSTGIGLYLSKQIANKLTHTIEMESKLGKGTKVRIGLHSEKVWID